MKNFGSTKKVLFALFGLGAGTIASAPGCASSTAAGTPSFDSSAVDAYIQASSQAQCDWEFKCCKDPEIKVLEGTKFDSKEACLPYRQLSQENTLFLERLAVHQGRLRVDPTHAAACLAQQTSRECNPMPGVTPPTTTTTDDDCSHVFVGNTPIGSECIFAQECIEGSHCVNGLAAGRGVCVPYQEKGDICHADSDCDPKTKNIYCAKSDYKCHVKGGVGEACSYTLDSSGANPTLPLLLQCDTTTANLYCDPVANTCAALPGDGEACLTKLPPGVASRCNPDPALQLVCDKITGGTCRAPGKVGASCTNLPCAADLYCSTGVSPTCTALPSLGESCSAAGYRCAKPYFCDFNNGYVCAQPAQLGQSCSNQTCDTGLYCDNTAINVVCKTQLADGTSCTSSTQCVSLSCGGAPATCLPRPVIASCTGR